MSTLTYGNYIFPIAPKITVTKTPIGTLPYPGGVKITWTITGELYSPYSQTPGAIAAMRDEMETALYRSGGLSWYSDSGVLIDSLTSSATLGVIVESVKFPSGDGTEYATHLPYEVVAWAEYPTDLLKDNPSPDLSDDDVFGEYSAIYTIDGEVVKLSISGTLYSVLWSAIQGEIVKIRLAVAPPMIVLTQSVTRSSRSPSVGDGETKLRADFLIEAIHGNATPDVIEIQETITVEEGAQESIPRVRFGGSPIIQTGPMRPTIITQSGSAVGLHLYPSFLLYAPLRYSLPLVSASRTKQTPRRKSDGAESGLTMYPITWSYQYVSGDPLAAPNDPATPSPSKAIEMRQ